MRSYFTGVIGYVFLVLFLALGGAVKHAIQAIGRQNGASPLDGNARCTGTPAQIQHLRPLGNAGRIGGHAPARGDVAVEATQRMRVGILPHPTLGRMGGGEAISDEAHPIVALCPRLCNDGGGTQ